jgi:hypothetical protein
MEQLAAHLWPASAAAAAVAQPAAAAAAAFRGDTMARAMLGACAGSLPSALRVYEMLLTRRAPGVPEADLAQLRLKVGQKSVLKEKW